MNKYVGFAMLVVPLVFSGCSTAPSGATAKAPPGSKNSQLEFALKSGSYLCEQKVRINIEREMRQGTNRAVTIAWNGSNHRLERNTSSSGLPRFEEASGGLVWIDLPWKGLLLDGKTSAPLANECRPA